jgi:hypothetical protein
MKTIIALSFEAIRISAFTDKICGHLNISLPSSPVDRGSELISSNRIYRQTIIDEVLCNIQMIVLNYNLVLQQPSAAK